MLNSVKSNSRRCVNTSSGYREIKEYAGIGKGVAYVDGKKVAEAELTFIIGR